MVLKHTRMVADYILRYGAHFRMVMEQQIKLESAEKIQSNGKRRQSIHIKYDGLDFIPLDKQMKAETA